MTPHAFITKWWASALKERSASQEHFIDLCHLLDEPTPAEADPSGQGPRGCSRRITLGDHVALDLGDWESLEAAASRPVGRSGHDHPSDSIPRVVVHRQETRWSDS